MNAQNYSILARKYRPQNFSDLIGQDVMVRTLTNAFETGRIAQAFMLTGVRGVGKTTTARILARALNYSSETIAYPSLELENYGEHCLEIIEGRHMDVVEMDAASHTGIDDIREIIEQIHYKPLSARYKIYIIDEIHMLSNQAFNGLLKTLEEPPEHVKFIFATTEIHKVPITILSRCQRFDLRRIENQILTSYLETIANKENVPFEAQALAIIARAATGSVRDALSLLDQAIAYSNGHIQIKDIQTMLGLGQINEVLDLFDHIMSGNTVKALENFSFQYKHGADPNQILQNLAEINHKIMKRRFYPDMIDMDLTSEQNIQIATMAEKLATLTLSRNWKMLLNALEEIKQAFMTFETAEMAIIRLCHAAHLPPLNEAQNALSQLIKNILPSKKSNFDDKIDLAQENETKNLAEDFFNSSKAIQKSLPEQKQLMESETQETIKKKVEQIKFETFENLLEFLENNQKSDLLYFLREQISIQSYHSGFIRYVLIKDSISTKTVAKKLREVTGINWQLEQNDLQKNETKPINYIESKTQNYVQNVENDPFVKKLLQSFPEAKIIPPKLSHK